MRLQLALSLIVVGILSCSQPTEQPPPGGNDDSPEDPLSCSPPSSAPAEPSGSWSFEGLKGATVHVLAREDGLLYAGTESGAYRRSELDTDSTWQRLGPGEAWIHDVLPFDSETILVATRISGEGGDTISLFRSDDAGTSWEPYQNGFGDGEGSNEVRRLAALDDGSILASGAGLVIARSTDGGASWNRVFGDWGVGGSLTVVETYEAWPTLVWAGGQGGFFDPRLLKSTDRGESWQNASTDVGQQEENSHLSVVVDPTDSTRVLTGMGGRVLRSVDAGESWETTLCPEIRSAFHGLGTSEVDPERVFAAGTVNTGSPQELVLHASDDGGASWPTRVVHPSATDGGVRSMLTARSGPSDVVILGTDDGVFRYEVTIEG